MKTIERMRTSVSKDRRKRLERYLSIFISFFQEEILRRTPLGALRRQTMLGIQPYVVGFKPLVSLI
jgi:hypothetical protein